MCIFVLIFLHFTFDNDGMKSSKRQVTFLPLIFLLKCFYAHFEGSKNNRNCVFCSGYCFRGEHILNIYF